MYVHFNNRCLKAYDSTMYYNEDESFRYDLITVDPKALLQLNDEEKNFLKNMGVKF